MDIRSVTTAPGVGTQGVAAVKPAAAPAAEPADRSTRLDSPVKIDIKSDPAPAAASHDARFTRDIDTNQIVLQVVDSASGQLVAQLPGEASLRARAYAAKTAERESQAPGLVRFA